MPKFRTKADEVEFLKDFVNGLPSSYLRDTLSPFVDDFERGVYNDFVPSVRDSWDARIEAEKQVKAVNAELEALRRQRDDLRRTVAREVASLREIASLAAKVVTHASYAEAQANSLERSTR